MMTFDRAFLPQFDIFLCCAGAVIVFHLAGFLTLKQAQRIVSGSLSLWVFGVAAGQISYTQLAAPAFEMGALLLMAVTFSLNFIHSAKLGRLVVWCSYRLRLRRRARIFGLKSVKKSLGTNVPRRSPVELMENRSRLLIDGPIDHVMAWRFRRQCEELMASKEPVLVTINSDGGDVNEARGMRESLALLAGTVELDLLVVGNCMSAATWVATAVPRNRRWATSGSSIMIHAARLVYESVPRLYAYADNNDQRSVNHNNRCLIEDVCSQTDIRQKDLEKLLAMGEEAYMTAAEAVSLGVVCGLIEGVLPTR